MSINDGDACSIPPFPISVNFHAARKTPSPQTCQMHGTLDVKGLDVKGLDIKGQDVKGQGCLKYVGLDTL